MEKIPQLEHTSNQTGRLLVYHIQQGDNDLNKYFLYKTVLADGILKSEGWLCMSDDFFGMHQQIINQGFYPMQPTEEDDPRILMTDI